MGEQLFELAAFSEKSDTILLYEAGRMLGGCLERKKKRYWEVLHGNRNIGAVERGGLVVKRDSLHVAFPSRLQDYPLIQTGPRGLNNLLVFLLKTLSLGSFDLPRERDLVVSRRVPFANDLQLLKILFGVSLLFRAHYFTLELDWAE